MNQPKSTPAHSRSRGLREPPEFASLAGLSPPDELSDAAADVRPLPDVAELEPSHLSLTIEHLDRRGVAAERSASPDLIGQLRQLSRRPADTLICNLLDCEPDLPLNAAWVAQHRADLLSGVEALARLSGAQQILIVLERDLPFAVIREMPETMRRRGTQIVRRSAIYPLSDPTVLLHRLLDRRLPPGDLPTEQRVLLLDGPAAVAVGAALARGEPMRHVPLILHDQARQCALFLRVPVGVSIGAALEAAQLSTGGVTIRAGDLLRDIELPPAHRIGAGELILHLCPTAPPVDPDSCIRCAWCVESCPTRIQPAGLLEAAQREDRILADRYGIGACIECGICSHVCPARLPLLPAIRKMKQSMRSN